MTEPYPLVAPEQSLLSARPVPRRPAAPPRPPIIWTDWLGWIVALALCLGHAYATWASMEGRAGIFDNPWPLWRNDHPLYYHSALVTRDFLKNSYTTAGYDPWFMSGYAKSVIFPASSTLPELVLFLDNGRNPAVAYKLYVLLSVASLPYWVLLAGVFLRMRPIGLAAGVFLFLLYLWLDFPIAYAALGMVPYLLAIPVALATTTAVVSFLELGGFGRWLVALLLSILSAMIHLTTAMIIVPAAGLAYLGVIYDARNRDRRLGGLRHLGFSFIPWLVLGANAFWWLPGISLSATKGSSSFAFAHEEGVLHRLGKIFTSESPMESVVLGLGLIGLAALAFHSRKARFAGLAGFAAAGFFWGYLAGAFRGLDFLQPGRHTFAFYSGLSLAGGYGVNEIRKRLRNAGKGRLDWLAALAMAGIFVRFLGPAVIDSVGRQAFTYPMLSSKPSPRMLWVMEKVAKHLKPGERLLYEEGGFAVKLNGRELSDPYEGGRFSGLLPEKTGVELIGGPYLHAALDTNFTQFGEGKLFEDENWDKDHFVRYAKLYRPSAILCWTPKARAFCESNPDLVQIVEDDGVLMLGRVKGFEGYAIKGKAEVKYEQGKLTVLSATPDLDGWVVLRYHSVPCLRSEPDTPWESVRLEGDPVPFIGWKSAPMAPLTIELLAPPRRR